MLDNEFDKYFRDRLLDHPSKVRVSLWKGVQTHLLHKGFNFWKWYIAGPSAVAAVVSGYVILTNFLPTNHNRKTATAVATYDTRHTTDSATTTTNSTADVAANPATSPTAAKDSTATTTPSSDPTTANPAAKTSSPAAMSTTGAGSVATTSPTAGPNTPTAAGPNAHAAAGPNTPTTPARNTTIRHPKGSANQSPALASSHRRRHPSSTEGSGVAGSTTAGTVDAETNLTAKATPSTNRTTTGPPIPAQLAAPAKLVALATPPAVKAKTPNGKNAGAAAVAVVPAKHKNTKDRNHDHDRLRIDVYGAPEFFAWHPIGISSATGLRLTAVFKKHFTFTSGVQYMRTNITHPNTLDSSNGLYPGYFKNIHIPVLLGYTYSNDHFTYSVYGGVLFSAYAQSKFTNPAATVTANPNGISGYLGLDISQHWANHFSYYAEPYLKCYFPPGDIDLPPQLWSVGLQLGLRCSF